MSKYHQPDRRPAVVTGAPAETDLLREETFGPVLPIVPVDSLEEAIASALAWGEKRQEILGYE